MSQHSSSSQPPPRRPVAKKKFGQHFLIHRAHIDRILDLVAAPSAEPILEIGPGPGSLTLPLHERGYSLTVVETDGEMVHHLEDMALVPAINIIKADFLQLDMDQLITSELKVVSNLPYNVSVPITARLLRKTAHIPRMVLMYQKEVAQRIGASPKTRDYGAFSVVCQCLYHIRKGLDLSPGAFYPPPKIWSRVLVFERRDDPLLAINQLDRLEQLLGSLFSHRRKMIGTILKKWVPVWTNSLALLESYLTCGFDPEWRPEVLQPDDYARWLKTLTAMETGE